MENASKAMRDVEQTEISPERTQGGAVYETSVPQVGRVDDDFVIDAALISELLDVPAAEVPALMRSRTITCICERGIDVDQGMFRLSLFYRERRARLRVDAMGRVVQRSIIDFGNRPLPRAQRTA